MTDDKVLKKMLSTVQLRDWMNMVNINNFNTEINLVFESEYRECNFLKICSIIPFYVNMA